MMSEKHKNVMWLSEEMLPLIMSLISSSFVSVTHDNEAVTYELCITNDIYLSMERTFIRDQQNQTTVVYTISIYDDNSLIDEDIAYMSVPLNRRIYMPYEQQIIDVFDACSKRVIQQEMQLLKNKIANMTDEYTYC